MHYKSISIQLTLFVLLLLTLPALGQKTSRYSYYIQFTDKNNSPYSVSNPLAFLSQKSLDRRAKYHASVTEQDLPVNPWYVDSLKAKGARVMFTSRWFNGATVAVDTDTIIREIQKLSFVKSASRVYKNTRSHTKNLEDVISPVYNRRSYDYGISYTQVSMLNGDYLHKKGYRGQGILIAVLDAGFYNVNKLSAFEHLYENDRVKAVHDFIRGDDSVYLQATHGLYVLSAIAGLLPGKLAGTAPEADFILLRSENGETEFPVEEDAWVAAAEFADSAGADIISSSLGYDDFDLDEMNHTYAEVNGHTVRASIAGNIAFSKGILVINSAGNEGNKPWKYISVPADGDSVMAIGAVDETGHIAYFSSYGFDSVSMIKPNVCALGVSVVVASTTNNETSTSSGTSLSCPLISGMAASLMSAFPDKTNAEIKSVIEKSANRYSSPNKRYGYGIPNFKLAYEMLMLTKPGNEEDFKLLELYPNPYDQDITLSIYSRSKCNVNISLYDDQGKLALQRNLDMNANTIDKRTLGAGQDLKPGVYFLILNNGTSVIKKKIIKTRDW